MTRARDLYGQPWREREYVIALHYYFEHKGEPRHDGSPFLQELAQVLDRTVGSVLMRMENFTSLDPDVNVMRTGLAHVSPLCRRVFDRWSGQRHALKACAELLVRDGHADNVPSLFEPEPVLLPRAFGKYELLDFIGEGSFGAVFSCIDPDSRQTYAMKIIRVDRMCDDECLHRFVREIRALKALEHPNVIRIHDENLDTERSFPAFVMELARKSLQEHFIESARASPDVRPVLPWPDRCDIFRSILKAADALHTGASRLVHRDINPANVLQTLDGRWVLADFSLAKFMPPVPVTSSFATTTSQGWATAYYASPEQYRSFRDVDERTDIYALGKLMWDLFSEEFPPPREAKPGLPGELTAVYLKATEWEPGRRYPTVKTFVDAFEGAASGLAPDGN